MKKNSKVTSKYPKYSDYYIFPKSISETRNSLGYLYSFNDKPSLVREDGMKEWHKDNQWHREIGPAVIWGNGIQEWIWENKSIK